MHNELIKTSILSYLSLFNFDNKEYNTELYSTFNLLIAVEPLRLKLCTNEFPA